MILNTIPLFVRTNFITLFFFLDDDCTSSPKNFKPLHLMGNLNQYEILVFIST